jgi:hypothetical protein
MIAVPANLVLLAMAAMNAPKGLPVTNAINAYLAALVKTANSATAAVYNVMMVLMKMVLATPAPRALPALRVINACPGALVKAVLALAPAPMIPVKTA